MKKIKQDLLKSTLIVCAVLAVSAFVLGFGSYLAQAWTPPPTSPPDGVVSAPLNVSASWQEKVGRLQIDNNVNPGPNNNDSLSVYANSGYSSLYVQQNQLGLGPLGIGGVAGYFAHNNKSDTNPDLDVSSYGVKGGYAGFFDGNLKVTGDLVVKGTVINLSSGKRLGASSFTPFQCNRDDASCGVAAQATCNAKCQNAADPGAGFCGSAWDDSGTLKNYTCDSTAKPSGTIRCNCLLSE